MRRSYEIGNQLKPSCYLQSILVLCCMTPTGWKCQLWWYRCIIFACTLHCMWCLPGCSEAHGCKEAGIKCALQHGFWQGVERANSFSCHDLPSETTRYIFLHWVDSTVYVLLLLENKISSVCTNVYIFNSGKLVNKFICLVPSFVSTSCVAEIYCIVSEGTRPGVQGFLVNY